MRGNPVFLAVIVPTDLGKSVVMNIIRVRAFVVWCSVKVWEGVFWPAVVFPQPESMEKAQTPSKHRSYTLDRTLFNAETPKCFLFRCCIFPI